MSRIAATGTESAVLLLEDDREGAVSAATTRVATVASVEVFKVAVITSFVELYVDARV